MIERRAKNSGVFLRRNALSGDDFTEKKMDDCCHMCKKSLAGKEMMRFGSFCVDHGSVKKLVIDWQFFCKKCAGRVAKFVNMGLENFADGGVA